MKTYLEPDDLDVRIEIIPLIDVIFCILVFFILGAVSFARTQGLNVDLPTAETAQTQFGDTLPVEIDALGQIKVEAVPVSDAQLSQILGAYVLQKPQGIVVLQADKLVSYGQVSRLIDTLQKVGGSRVALGAIKQDPSSIGNPGAIPASPDLLPTQPNLTQPNLTQPNLAQPNLVQPNSVQPNSAQPNFAQPNTPLMQPSVSVPQPNSVPIPGSSALPQPSSGLPSGSIPTRP